MRLQIQLLRAPIVDPLPGTGQRRRGVRIRPQLDGAFEKRATPAESLGLVAVAPRQRDTEVLGLGRVEFLRTIQERDHYVPCAQAIREIGRSTARSFLPRFKEAVHGIQPSEEAGGAVSVATLEPLLPGAQQRRCRSGDQGGLDRRAQLPTEDQRALQVIRRAHVVTGHPLEMIGRSLVQRGAHLARHQIGCHIGQERLPKPERVRSIPDLCHQLATIELRDRVAATSASSPTSGPHSVQLER